MKTKDKIVNALTGSGFMPTEKGGRIFFIHKMTFFLYQPSEPDQNYLALYIPAFYPIFEGEADKVLKVMNECNCVMKGGRLISNTMYVAAVSDMFISEDTVLDNILKKCVDALYEIKERFEKMMCEERTKNLN